MEWRQEDLEQMKRIEREVVKAILPHAGSTEAGLAAIALVRQARVLIRKYPNSVTQKELTQVMCDFLKGETSPTGAPQGGLIWSPG